MTDRETAHALRGIVTRAVVRSTNDTGASQTATVTTHRHVDRSDVEIIQPFGMASRAPKGGSVIVLAAGGDQGDLIGLPVAALGNRMGGLGEGETVIHNAKGDRVLLKADGEIVVTTANKVTVKAKTTVVSVERDRVTARVGTGGARTVVRSDYVKLRKGVHYLVVSDNGITTSVAPVVGPDPEPAV